MRWIDRPSAVAVLRLAAGRYADDERLTELVGKLSVKSDDFAAMWPAGGPLEVCRTRGDVGGKGADMAVYAAS